VRLAKVQEKPNLDVLVEKLYEERLGKSLDVDIDASFSDLSKSQEFSEPVYAYVQPDSDVYHILVDDYFVKAPKYVIEYLVWHEICHIELAERADYWPDKGERTDEDWHGPEFTVLEVTYPKYSKAVAWLKSHETAFKKRYWKRRALK
jgi:hypothetical protein